MKKKYHIDCLDCVLTTQRFIGLNSLSINKNGCLEMSFDQLAGELDGKHVVCSFDSYLYVSVLDEYFDTSTERYSNLGENESVQSKFGPVLIFKDSPWIGETEGILLEEPNSVPSHYVFITVDDIIEIVSSDIPVFKINEFREHTI